MENLGFEPYTIHATRHTFNSLLADLDVSPTIRSKLARHSQGDIIETVYTHLDVSVLLDAVNKLECFIVAYQLWTKKRCNPHRMHLIHLCCR